MNNKKNSQLHAVSRTQQGRQREPSVKTLRSPLSSEMNNYLKFLPSAVLSSIRNNSKIWVHSRERSVSLIGSR